MGKWRFVLISANQEESLRHRRVKSRVVLKNTLFLPNSVSMQKNVKSLKNKQEKESTKIELRNGDDNISCIGL